MFGVSARKTSMNSYRGNHNGRFFFKYFHAMVSPQRKPTTTLKAKGLSGDNSSIPTPDIGMDGMTSESYRKKLVNNIRTENRPRLIDIPSTKYSYCFERDFCSRNQMNEISILMFYRLTNFSVQLQITSTECCSSTLCTDSYQKLGQNDQ